MKSNQAKVLTIISIAMLAGCGGNGGENLIGSNGGVSFLNPGKPSTNANELDAPEILAANANEISGKAVPGSLVKVGIYDAQNNVLTDVKSVVANGLGEWKIETSEVGWGNQAIIAANAVKQKESSPISTPFLLDRKIPAVQEVRIKQLIGDDNTLIGTMPVGSILKVDVDNDGIIDKVIEPDKFGNWQLDLGAEAQIERVTIELTDAAGNVSPKISKNLPVKNKVSGDPEDPTLPGGGEIDPTIDRFLSDDVAGKGQQNSPIVASIKYGTTMRGAVKFNQPGVVSEVCRYGEEECTSTRFERAIKNANDKITEAQEKLDEKKKQEDASLDAEEKELKDAKQKLKDLERDLPGSREVVIRDVNNFIVKLVSQGTIDLQNLRSSLGGNYLIFQDAGIVNIDQKRVNGQLRNHGGSIGREFNSVLLFGDPLNEYFVDAYFRDPAAAGWSYQTFGAFSNQAFARNRDLNIGYQSFGQQTEATAIPKNGKATYKGLSHAYYNNDQVTSHNAIEVDFSNKNLTYRTTDTPILHTFENGMHVIEEKPELSIRGNAKWERANRFVGRAVTDAGLSGTLEGQFFGPNVQELGGVYGLSGRDANGTVHYVGGFGAKR